jgi:hypothetical protein
MIYCEGFLDCPMTLIIPISFFAGIGYGVWLYIKKGGILDSYTKGEEE